MVPPLSSRQLEWVQRNRQPRSRAAPIGAALKSLVKGGFEAEARHRAEILRAVSEIVDDGFREACTLGQTDRRALTILVEHPATLYALRLAWCFRLIEHLELRCHFHQTPRIRFRLGRSPDRFMKHEQLTN
jgi:hypothetical protein